RDCLLPLRPLPLLPGTPPGLTARSMPALLTPGLRWAYGGLAFPKYPDTRRAPGSLTSGRTPEGAPSLLQSAAGTRGAGVDFAACCQAVAGSAGTCPWPERAAQRVSKTRPEESQDRAILRRC